MPLQHLEFVIQALHKATGVSIHQVVRNRIPPPIQRVQEIIETTQATVTDARLPRANLRLPLGWVSRLFKDRRQLFAQKVCGF